MCTFDDPTYSEKEMKVKKLTSVSQQPPLIGNKNDKHASSTVLRYLMLPKGSS